MADADVDEDSTGVSAFAAAIMPFLAAGLPSMAGCCARARGGGGAGAVAAGVSEVPEGPGAVLVSPDAAVFACAATAALGGVAPGATGAVAATATVNATSVATAGVNCCL